MPAIELYSLKNIPPLQYLAAYPYSNITPRSNYRQTGFSVTTKEGAEQSKVFKYGFVSDWTPRSPLVTASVKPPVYAAELAKVT